MRDRPPLPYLLAVSGRLQRGSVGGFEFFTALLSIGILHPMLQRHPLPFRSRPCSKTWQVCLMTRDLSKVFRSHAALLSSSHTAFLCLWSQRLWCINIKSNFRGLLGDVFCSVCRSSSWHNRSTDLRRLAPMSSFWTNNDPAFLAADSYAHVMEGF